MGGWARVYRRVSVAESAARATILVNPVPDVPSTIGRYQVLEMVGRGGMGVLYRARDPVLDREVALKVLRDFTADAATRERLAREARAVARMQHRNIVTIHDFGEADGVPYIAMEFLRGQDLEVAIRTRQPYTLLQKLDIAIQLCDALAYAHARGLVHRDIKPGNVRVLEDGTVKVMDFGIARFAQGATTESVGVVGTIGYMAPEQISGQTVDGRADLFSAGALLFELLSGTPVFGGGTTVQVIYRVLHVPPPPLRLLAPDVPGRLERIVTRALEKDAANRYGQAAEMAADLRSVVQQLARADGSPSLGDSVEDDDTDFGARVGARTFWRALSRFKITIGIGVAAVVGVALFMLFVKPGHVGPSAGIDTARQLPAKTGASGQAPPARERPKEVVGTVLTVLDEPTAGAQVDRPGSLPDMLKARKASRGQAPRDAGRSSTPVQALERISGGDPEYPPAAIAGRIEGRVVLDLKVGPDGKVASAVVVNSIPQLDQAAIDAVLKWQYKPVLRDGQPRTVTVRIGLDFFFRH
jgi:serine/threonine-protein kinase